MNSAFHLSLPCNNIEDTKNFYVEDLGLECGRSSDQWIDINLFSHQITFIEVDEFKLEAPNYTLDGTILPTFHFGVILNNNDWEKIHNNANNWMVDVITKDTFFKDKTSEHMSFFVEDPNGYTIEFKTFVDNDAIFEF
tara:strand:+ start:1881 stop:2294 length:414 start_codon:yes stop_codon:yes gene_type:complete